MTSPREKTLRRVRQLLVATVAIAPGCTDKGYAVVDPMPEPARCSGTAGRLFITATWEASDGGSFLLVFVIERPADVKIVGQAQSSSNTPIVSTELGPPTVLKVADADRAGNAEVSIGVQCGTSTGLVDITASWNEAPRQGGTVRTTAVDR